MVPVNRRNVLEQRIINGILRLEKRPQHVHRETGITGRHGTDRGLLSRRLCGQPVAPPLVMHRCGAGLKIAIRYARYALQKSMKVCTAGTITRDFG
jgi:hypothetical protein